MNTREKQAVKALVQAKEALKALRADLEVRESKPAFQKAMQLFKDGYRRAEQVQYRESYGQTLVKELGGERYSIEHLCEKLVGFSEGSKEYADTAKYLTHLTEESGGAVLEAEQIVYSDDEQEQSLEDVQTWPPHENVVHPYYGTSLVELFGDHPMAASVND